MTRAGDLGVSSVAKMGDFGVSVVLKSPTELLTTVAGTVSGYIDSYARPTELLN